LDLKCTLPFFDLLLRLLDLDHVSGRRTLVEILQQLLERLLVPLSFAFDLSHCHRCSSFHEQIRADGDTHLATIRVRNPACQAIALGLLLREGAERPLT